MFRGAISQGVEIAEQAGYGVVVFNSGAHACLSATQLLEDHQCEVRFLTSDNTTLSVILPEEAIYVPAIANEPPPED